MQKALCRLRRPAPEPRAAALVSYPASLHQMFPPLMPHRKVNKRFHKHFLPCPAQKPDFSLLHSISQSCMRDCGSCFLMAPPEHKHVKTNSAGFAWSTARSSLSETKIDAALARHAAGMRVGVLRWRRGNMVSESVRTILDFSSHFQ